MQGRADTDTLATDGLQNSLYLTFSIGTEVFGIGIDHVKEIIGIQPITRIPEFPEHIKGVINLRGGIIPVMDVRLRFRKPPQEYDARTCIIVVDIFDILVGLIVDRVAEVVTIPESEIAATPEINRRNAGYIKGFGKVGGEIKLLLDCGILLGEDTRTIKLNKENGR